MEAAVIPSWSKHSSPASAAASAPSTAADLPKRFGDACEFGPTESYLGNLGYVSVWGVRFECK